VPVVALFGPTDERMTSPVGRRDAMVLTSPAWCRPCMLRECPLDHRCLAGIPVDVVVRAVKERI
jgi:heptosyltransferase-2